jgi:hypothetical protein
MFLRTAKFLYCVHGAIVGQASDARKRFDPLAAPLGDLSYSRSPDGSSQRHAVIPESQRPTSMLGEARQVARASQAINIPLAERKAGQRVGQWRASRLGTVFDSDDVLMASNH